VFARALVVWCAAAALASGGAARLAEPAGAPRPFSHKEHVSDAWLQVGRLPEVWRDCRGCHRFDADNLVSAPQRECDKCHTGAGVLSRQFDEGWQNDLSGHRTRTRDGFRHHTHGMLECRECHAPFYDDRGRPDFGVLYAHFEIQTGPGQCARCHDGEAEVGRFRWFGGALDTATAQALGMPPFQKPADEAAYAKKLVTVFAGPTGGLNNPELPVGGDFDHGDHLGIGCVDCHTNIERASASAVGTGEIPVAKCGDCHVADERKTAVRPAKGGVQRERPLFSLGAFAHGDHFGFRNGQKKDGVCKAEAYAELEKGCTVCHTYRPEAPGRAGRDFPFTGETSKHRYSDCEQCHAVPGWSTGETKKAPLHSSNGGNWSQCADCHLLGEPDLATRRPTVPAERFTERTFVFASNTHPDITQLGVDRAGRPAIDDCRQCHRARVPELATRIEAKVFRHDTHLPPSPTAEHCASCHPSAKTAVNAASLAPDYRTYSLAGCKTCHWGGEVTERAVEGEKPGKRDVVAFPHGPHVEKGLSCTECHALDAGGRDVATKPEALACNQCHDHERDPNDPKDSRVEGLFDGAVGSCVHCHHEDTRTKPVLAVPARRGSDAVASDPRYHVTQTMFAGFADTQFHPLGVACTDCHKANVVDGALQPIRVPTVENGHLPAARQASVHVPDQQKSPAECLRCHWKPVGVWGAAVDNAAGELELKKLRKLPRSAPTRERFGNDAEGYPGGGRSRG
jgi:hypothetical protein